MTGEVGILLALAAGLLLADRRQVVRAVLFPFVVVLVIQTWAIHAGHAVSPPSTVTEVQYWAVQGIILGCALGFAVELSGLRFRGVPGKSPIAGISRTALAYRAGGAASAVVVLGNLAHAVATDQWNGLHHTAEGSPPLVGVIGIAALVLGFAGLSVLTLRRRGARRAAGV